MARHTAVAIMFIVVGLSMGACESPSKPAWYQAPARVSGLERLELPIGGVLLVKPDHHMASYDHLMVDPIVITYKSPSDRLGEAETQRLAEHLREATAQELVNVDPSKIVTEPGPCVLQMQTAFIDLELPPVSTSTGSRSGYVSSHGAVTLVHELRDSTTGTVLLRYMGRRRAAGGSSGVHASRWSGLVRLFEEMLHDLQTSLVESVPLSTATEGPLAECKGEIYRRIEAENPTGP